MNKAFTIEDIETVRLQEGIDDVELREIVGHLAAGDCIRLTFLVADRPSHTLMVRITRAEGRSFRGRLIQCPAKGIPNGLHLGRMFDFQGTQIHSVVRTEAGKKDQRPAQ